MKWAAVRINPQTVRNTIKILKVLFFMAIPYIFAMPMDIVIHRIITAIMRSPNMTEAAMNIFLAVFIFFSGYFPGSFLLARHITANLMVHTIKNMIMSRGKPKISRGSINLSSIS